MQPRTDDRFLLHLAAWLDSIEHFDEDIGCDSSGPRRLPIFEKMSDPHAAQGGGVFLERKTDLSSGHGAARAAGSVAGLEARKLETITRRTVLEHPLLAPRLDELYHKAREVNATLPKELKHFIDETLNGSGEVSFVSKGRVKWQAALFHGLMKSRAAAWTKSAKKKDKDRVKEMAGEWITAEPPWWTHFPRPTWLIAMRLRYALPVTPAMGNILARRCLARKIDGSYCLEILDAHGVHAGVCKVENSSVHRHDTIRDGLVPALKPLCTCVKLEQFIFELAQFDCDTGETREARMDIVAEMPTFRAMLDIRCFVSTLKSGWRSTRSHEIEKHTRYVTHKDGRRLCNMKLFAAVVNTYGCIGSEFKDFCAAIEADKRGSARGRSLGLTLSLLGVYANAEKVLQIHTPPYQRAQKQEVLSAIAEKDAALAAAEASRPPGEVPKAGKDPALAAGKASRPPGEVPKAGKDPALAAGKAPKAPAGVPRAQPAAVAAKQAADPAKKQGPGNFAHINQKRRDIRGEITGTPASATEPERRMIQCLACNDLVKYTSWPYHCNKNHSCPYISRKKHPHIEVDEKNKNDDDDEDESNREVKDREKRPEKPAKRRLSEPKPICTINPNVKKVSPKAKKAKSTSASKEK